MFITTFNQKRVFDAFMELVFNNNKYDDSDVIMYELNYLFEGLEYHEKFHIVLCVLLYEKLRYVASKTDCYNNEPNRKIILEEMNTFMDCYFYDHHHFTVVCDETNNTLDVISSKKINVEVKYKYAPSNECYASISIFFSSFDTIKLRQFFPKHASGLPTNFKYIITI